MRRLAKIIFYLGLRLVFYIPSLCKRAANEVLLETNVTLEKLSFLETSFALRLSFNTKFVNLLYSLQ